MILDIYNFFMEKLFTTEALPTILQPVSEELCALASVTTIGVVIGTVVGIAAFFFRAVTGLALRRW